MTNVYVWVLSFWKALIQLDVPTTSVAYVEVTSTISNWITIKTASQCGLDLSRSDRAIQLQVWTALWSDRDLVAIG